MKKKSNKKKEDYIIALVIVIMISGIFIIDKINRDTLEENKFVAEIWGTVSDWYMVIVTMITAIFLYKTLKSQKDVQESQKILQEIEVKRFRKTIEPNFYIERKSNTEERPDSKTFTFLIEPTGELPKKIEFISDHMLKVIHFQNKSSTSKTKTYNSEIIEEKKHYINAHKSIKMKEFLSLEVTVLKADYKKNTEFDSVVIIRFEDEAEYKYEKHIFLKYSNTHDVEGITINRTISDLIYC